MAMDAAEFDAYLAGLTLPPQPNAPGFWTTVKRTGGQMLGGAGEIVGDVSGNPENALARMADDIIARNPSGINSLQDIADSPGLALKEAGGNALTFLIPYLGAGKVMQLMRAGPAAATAVQAALAGVPSLGEIGDSQRETGSENGLLKYGGAATVGAIENLLGAQRVLGPMVGMKGLGRAMTEQEARAALEAPLKTFGKQWARTGAEEGLEESMQTPIERFAGGKPVADVAGVDETLLSTAMGALGGIALGPLAAGGHRSQASGLVRQVDEARATLDEPLTSLEQIPKQRSAASFLQGVMSNDFGPVQAAEFAVKQRSRIQGEEKSLLDGIAEKADTARMQEEWTTKREVTLEALKERFDLFQQEQDYWASKEAKSAAKKDTGQVETDPTVRWYDQLAATEMVPQFFGRSPAMSAPMPQTPLEQVATTTDLLGVTRDLPRPRAQPYEAQFDTRNVNDFVSLGTRIGAALEQARATGDAPVIGLLERIAQGKIYDRMAEGFGTQQRQQMVAGRPTPANTTLVPPAEPATQQELFGTRGEPTYAAAPDLPAEPAAVVDPASKSPEKRRQAIAVDAGLALANNQIDEVQYADVMRGVTEAQPPKEIRARLEEYLGPTRSAAAANAEGTAQGRSVAGRSVAAAGATNSQPDGIAQPVRAGGVVAGSTSIEPVAASAAQNVAPTTKEKQNGPVEESPVPAQGADEGQVPVPAQEARQEDQVISEAGIPESVLKTYKVGYDAGLGEHKVSARQALDSIDQRIADHEAFLACLRG